MDPKRNELKDRLLAQQTPDPEKLAEYRKGVEAMLEQLHRERWWVGLAYAVLMILGTVALFFGAFGFGIVGVYLASAQGAGPAEFLLPGLGSVLCLAGAVVLLRRWNHRTRSQNLLLEVKRLEMRVLELEESQRNQSEK